MEVMDICKYQLYYRKQQNWQVQIQRYVKWTNHRTLLECLVPLDRRVSWFEGMGGARKNENTTAMTQTQTQNASNIFRRRAQKWSKF